MDYHALHMKTVAELRRIAKEAKLKVPAGTNKATLVMMILEQQKNAAMQAEEIHKSPEQEKKSPAQPWETSAPVQKPARAEAEGEGMPDLQMEAAAGAQPCQRRLSTQQRMGARTHPQQGFYRPQQAVRPSVQRAQYPGRTAADEPANPQRFAQNSRRPLNADAAQAANRPFSPDASRNPVSNEEMLNPGVPELLNSGECGDGAGIMEIHADGYGFLRAENYLPGNRDVYVSAAQIRRFNLRTGDYVTGKTRQQPGESDRSVGLIYVSSVNGQPPEMARRRRFFDSLVPVYPDERLRMERPGEKDISLRLMDMIAPVGKGQRGMIVSPPKSGKTTLLKKIANAITANNPDVHLIVLLIDERPEEVTDMKRSIQGEVVYSTFDEAPENHTRVSEMVLERAQRLVELGKDVVILLDSITRLARAYNLVIPPTGRSLSGGLDPGALHRPKRFFGAARNIENGGSLTIIATALVDTGSRMDDIIFEEFKGTGNMELHLDRSLSDRRIFPAIDLYKSGTRREELLLDKEELAAACQVRRMLSRGNPQDAAEQLISMVEKSPTNKDFCQKLKNWVNVCEKDGFN